MSGVSIRGRIEEELPRTPASPLPQVPRLARMLALAYLVDRLVEDGKLWDYAHAARVLGVSRARMTQIVNLACLPVREQEDVLLGRTSASERQMRAGDVA